MDSKIVNMLVVETFEGPHGVILTDAPVAVGDIVETVSSHDTDYCTVKAVVATEEGSDLYKWAMELPSAARHSVQRVWHLHRSEEE